MTGLIICAFGALILYVAFSSSVWSYLTPWVESVSKKDYWTYTEETRAREFWRITAAICWPFWLLQWPFRFAWWLGQPIPKLPKVTK